MESLIIIDMAVDNFFDTMGKRIRILRDDRKMNQTEMANRMGQFGQKVDPSYLSQIERGDKAPSLSVFKAIVQVLESTADYLLLLTDDPDTPGESVNETWSEVTRDIADIIDALPEAKRLEIMDVVRAMTAHVVTEGKQAPDIAVPADIGDQTYMYGRLANGNAQHGDNQPKTRAKRKVRR